MLPQVSIILPTYNRAHYLPEALESALGQTYPNLEVIVVNDGSTDETETVLAPYMNKIRYLRQQNRGCAAAKNTGLAAARGELITNLDDDDRIHPQKIAQQVEAFQKLPSLGICGTGVNFIDAEGRTIERYIPPRFSKKNQVLQLLRRCFLVQSSVMIHRKCHDRLGPYKAMLSEDYEFWLRVSLHYEIGVVEDYLTDYRQHGNQLTGPSLRPQMTEAVAQVIGDFIAQTPMDQIIPGVHCYPPGYVLIGLLLCEHHLFSLAQTYIEPAHSHPVGQFGLGLIRLHERKFAEANACFEGVKASDSPFGPQVEEALTLAQRIQHLLTQPNLGNTSPEVVQLRKDFSRFRTTVIRGLLQLATAPSECQLAGKARSKREIMGKTQQRYQNRHRDNRCETWHCTC